MFDAVTNLIDISINKINNSQYKKTHLLGRESKPEHKKRNPPEKYEIISRKNAKQIQ